MEKEGQGMSRYLSIAAALAAFFLIAILGSAPSRAEMDAAQKAEIEKIVRDYILANPEILDEAAQALQQKRDQELAESQMRAIEEKAQTIFNSEHQAVIGNPDGAITLVEFFDYNCSYCRRAVSDMTALLEANPDVRMVMKEFPILSEGSVEAARISVAVKDIAPDKYLAFHQELFTRPGQAGTAKALQVAADLGLDAEALKAAANAGDVTQSLQEVHQLATDLGISGTPSYVIGKAIIPGAIGFDGLQSIVSAVRQCGATVC
jgi:protein-disulfide isomerase